MGYGSAFQRATHHSRNTRTTIRKSRCRSGVSRCPLKGICDNPAQAIPILVQRIRAGRAARFRLFAPLASVSRGVGRSGGLRYSANRRNYARSLNHLKIAVGDFTVAQSSKSAMVFRYCIASFTVAMLSSVSVATASAQKAPSAKPFERFDGCVLRARRVDGRR